MTSNEIRQHFLDYFTKKRQHTYVHSAPLVLKNDPTLMFTNAGMNQFKDYFLGNKVADFKRVANSQKCLRVTGKHNDLEDVGHDTYHHTMFEMLGNWSFGDYFKKEAIAWSWELLTEVYKLPKDRLYATVFGGDEKEGLEPDNEAKELWLQYLPESQILYGSKKDNFWEMGEQGPCGPCSEIHIDIRDIEEIQTLSGRELVNNDHPHVIEIWNNVFIQYNRKADGSLEQLPDKHVDTGMGFERLCMVTQGKKSNYDTDVFQHTIQFLASEASKIAGKTIKYGEEKKSDIAMRVIADHIRAISFAIADGQLPSNNKAGYVIRRILRRAVRYGYTFLGFRQPFLHSLVKLLAVQFEGIFPEIKAQQTFIENVIREEENSFLHTLENGLKMLESLFPSIKQSSNQTIEGKIVFELYDTFGFPVDLTALIARENGLKIDEEGFKLAMQTQKDRSRQASASEKSDWITLNEGEEVEFVGYEYLESQTKILRYRKLTDKKKTSYQLVLESTPFYAESGGQVGDTGYLELPITNDKLVKIHITDTKKENDLIVHFTEDNFEEILKQLTTNNEQPTIIKAVVNKNRRSLTENNHSATHLMHAALRKVLGTHVAQKGSLVNDEILRFDFSHFAKLSEQEIAEVESIVNQKIRENIVLDERRNVAIEEAKNLGAMALFGEKYGNFVRMVVFDKNYSIELCGGTHVPSTGKIGTFKIIGESSSSAGVRRIEAVTAEKAEAFMKQRLELLDSVREALKNPKDLIKAITDLQDEKSKVEKELERLQSKELNAIKTSLLSKVQDKNGISFIAEKVEVPKTESLKTLSFQLKQEIATLFSVLVAEIDDKAHIAVMISDNLLKNEELNASKVVKELAKLIEGGGGGQAFFATAAGKDLKGVKAVLENAQKLIENPSYVISVPIKEEKETKSEPISKSIVKPQENIEKQIISFGFDKMNNITSLCSSLIKKEKGKWDARNVFWGFVIDNLDIATIFIQSFNITKCTNKQETINFWSKRSNHLLNDINFEANYISFIQTHLFFAIFIDLEELMNRLAEELGINPTSKPLKSKPMFDAIVDATTKKQEHYRLFEVWLYTRNTIHNRGFHNKEDITVKLDGKDYVFKCNHTLSWFEFNSVLDLTNLLVNAIQEIISCDSVKNVDFIPDRFHYSTPI